jgi:hypothetical protein
MVKSYIYIYIVVNVQQNRVVCGPEQFFCQANGTHWIWLSEFVFLVILSEETIAIYRQGFSTLVVHFFSIL